MQSLVGQCDWLIVIDNASEPCVDEEHLHNLVTEQVKIALVIDPEQPPNLSRLWNQGMDMAKLLHGLTREIESQPDLPYDIAIINDDAIIPPGWWDALTAQMRGYEAVAASGDPFAVLTSGESRIYHGDAPMHVTTRLAGWAFMLRGEAGLRADERLRWWYADDLLSLQARQRGGLVHVGGFLVQNTGANSSTVGELAEQAGRDRQTFIDITGVQPW